MYTQSQRQAFLYQLNSDQAVVSEVLDYCQNRFSSDWEKLGQLSHPEDDPQVPVWKAYIADAHQEGVFPVLQRYIPAFRFPIAEGISQSPSYRAATRQGKSLPVEGEGLKLQAPKQLNLHLYKSLAGNIPVLEVPNSDDFANIIRALAYKNEPALIPSSMGASMLGGLNNWHRIGLLRAAWQAQNPGASWNTHFRSHILPQKILYQDRLIVLSEKPYSGVSHVTLGLEEKAWLDHSSQIRRAHEVVHYFTKKYMGGMYIHLHDELIADYIGIKEAANRFIPTWFLHFMGLEGPTYRAGGRMENYTADAAISADAQGLLQHILRLAALQLAQFDSAVSSGSLPASNIAEICTLCAFSLDEMAQPHAHQKMKDHYQEIRPSVDQPMPSEHSA